MTYHCQRAYDLSWRVDVAIDELTDEVGCHAHDGDHRHHAQAASDDEGLCEWGEGGHDVYILVY